MNPPGFPEIPEAICDVIFAAPEASCLFRTLEAVCEGIGWLYLTTFVTHLDIVFKPLYEVGFFGIPASLVKLFGIHVATYDHSGAPQSLAIDFCSTNTCPW